MLLDEMSSVTSWLLLVGSRNPRRHLADLRPRQRDGVVSAGADPAVGGALACLPPRTAGPWDQAGWMGVGSLGQDRAGGLRRDRPRSAALDHGAVAIGSEGGGDWVAVGLSR